MSPCSIYGVSTYKDDDTRLINVIMFNPMDGGYFGSLNGAVGFYMTPLL